MNISTLHLKTSCLSQGVVRIHLVEAQNLAAKDNYVKGVMAGLSDPYAILRVGPQTFTSKHIDNTDSPKWGEIYEVGRMERIHSQFYMCCHSACAGAALCISPGYHIMVLIFIFIHKATASKQIFQSVSFHVVACVWCIRL